MLAKGTKKLTECSFKRCVKYVCIMAIPAIAGFSPSSQKKAADAKACVQKNHILKVMGGI